MFCYTPNSAYMEFGYMEFVGDFSVIWTFSLINCSMNAQRGAIRNLNYRNLNYQNLVLQPCDRVEEKH